MSARGQKFTAKWKQPVYYSDFTNTFECNPTTGALATVTNVASINQSIRNLVFTPLGSRVGRNGLGSKTLSSLFDLAVPTSLNTLTNSIKEVIENFEKRATNVSVTVINPDQIQNNGVTVEITYTPINLPQTETFSLVLSRVR